MTETAASRRDFLKTAAAGAVAASAVAAATTGAEAYQDNMERALSAL